MTIAFRKSEVMEKLSAAVRNPQAMRTVLLEPYEIQIVLGIIDDERDETKRWEKRVKTVESRLIKARDALEGR